MSFVDDQISHEYVKYRGCSSSCRLQKNKIARKYKFVMIANDKVGRRFILITIYCVLVFQYFIFACIRYIYSHFEYYTEIG